MAKIKTAYFCQNCGHEAAKWLGRCPSCNEWNTFVEEIIAKPKNDVTSFVKSNKRKSKPQLIKDVTVSKEERKVLKDNELNRVLGGGLVEGALVLFGGEPGIGKSTLMLQTAMNEVEMKVLYISGEESEQQVKMRAERIGELNPNCFLFTETSIEHIFTHAEDILPDLLIIDSIQTLHSESIESAPGSVSQIRECTAQLLRFSKQTGTPVFLIGHITKEGGIAGPKVLEHMVDAVLNFEGDRNYVYRLLRAVKNRFGSTNELGIYEMLSDGLREVANPSEILISDQKEQFSGTAIAATLEGLRPMLIEVQALVSTAAYGTPQRSATGFDLRRLNMLLAVMEKRCGFKLGAKDVFLNIAGGIKVNDPGIDLAVVAAVLSSNADLAIQRGVCLAAEVGLSGELRSVSRVDQRVAEAEKLGLKKIIIAQNTKNVDFKGLKIEVVVCSRVEEVLKVLFT